MNKELIQKVQQGTHCRWVKASERLPDLVMSVNLKLHGRPGFGKFFETDSNEINLGFEASNGFGTYYPHQFENVEWLEELPSTSEAPLQEVRELLSEIDELLCFLEDTAHGEEGRRITKMRGKLIPHLNPVQEVRDKEEGRQDITSFVDENFAGLKDAIDDEDVFLWYRDLIIAAIEEYATPHPASNKAVPVIRNPFEGTKPCPDEVMSLINKRTSELRSDKPIEFKEVRDQSASDETPVVIKGDYVVATKYPDGSGKDHFVVGFFDSMTAHSAPRFNIVDAEGKLFRHNGFRKAKKISKEVGDKIVANIKNIEDGEKSVWEWVALFENETPVKDWTIKEDMICPATGEHCDDECCPVGAECNLKDADKLGSPIQPSK